MYILAGMFGNLFSVVFQQPPYNTVSVGASTALYGVDGLLIGYLIINYSALSFLARLRCFLIFMILIMLVFTILTSAVVPNVDYLGHVGGTISGVWLAAIPPSIKFELR